MRDDTDNHIVGGLICIALILGVIALEFTVLLDILSHWRIP
jgi:hypothetical protein